VTRTWAAKYNPVIEATPHPAKIGEPKEFPMTEPGQMFSDGKTYERMMGRWSKLAGRIFLDWLDPPKNLDRGRLRQRRLYGGTDRPLRAARGVGGRPVAGSARLRAEAARGGAGAVQPG
jgi:hypothetical protein